VSELGLFPSFGQASKESERKRGVARSILPKSLEF
jgi:hypothetical protein